MQKLRKHDDGLDQDVAAEVKINNEILGIYLSRAKISYRFDVDIREREVECLCLMQS